MVTNPDAPTAGIEIYIYTEVCVVTDVDPSFIINSEETSVVNINIFTDRHPLRCHNYHSSVYMRMITKLFKPYFPPRQQNNIL